MYCFNKLSVNISNPLFTYSSIYWSLIPYDHYHYSFYPCTIFFLYMLLVYINNPTIYLLTYLSYLLILDSTIFIFLGFFLSFFPLYVSCMYLCLCRSAPAPGGINKVVCLSEYNRIKHWLKFCFHEKGEGFCLGRTFLRVRKSKGPASYLAASWQKNVYVSGDMFLPVLSTWCRWKTCRYM